MGPAPQFIDAVFNEQEKSAPDAGPATQGIAVFQLLEVKPASTPSFEEIRSRVDRNSRTSGRACCCRRRCRSFPTARKLRHDLKKAAKELGATVKTSDFVLPDGQVPDVGSMAGQASVAFNMKPGEISGPINEGATASVLELIENQPPTDADYAAKRDQIRDSLLQAKQQERFDLIRDQPRRPDDEIGQDSQERRRT